MEIKVTRDELLELLGLKLKLKKKEIEVLQVIVKLNTTDRHILAKELNTSPEIVSNYKSVLAKKKLISGKNVNRLLFTDKMTFYVNI